MSPWNPQRTGGSSPNVPPCRGVFFKVKTKKRPWKTSKEAITAWLWAEDKKAVARLKPAPDQQQIVVAL